MKPLATALALTAALTVAACSSGGEPARDAGQQLEVLAAFYPYQFVADRVGGSAARVESLTEPGVEPHDLELSPQQVVKLGRADLVLYSRGFQPAVDEAVDQTSGDAAFDVATVQELQGGDEALHEEGQEHEDGEADAEPGLDPHVWLDPVRLAGIAEAVAERMAQESPENAGGFRTRAAALTADLTALDREMDRGLSTCERKELVTSHTAFGYLAERYGLEQVAVTGLSPDATPSPARLAEVARYAKENGVTTIFFEELVSSKTAESLASEVGATARVLSPLESPPEQGDYLSAMRENLETLRTALGCT